MPEREWRLRLQRSRFVFQQGDMMFRYLLAVVAAMSFTTVLAQEQQGDKATEKSAPATKIEAFSSRIGIVVIKGFKEMGEVRGMGRVVVDAREFRDASHPRVGQYGVSIQVKESGRLERENTSFIDEDEIDSLIKGIDYISKIDRNVTALGNFEAQYRTKGDFSVTVFSTSGGGNDLAVSSGRIGRASAFLKLADAEKLKALLLEAKQAIASAKSALAVLN